MLLFTCCRIAPLSESSTDNSGLIFLIALGNVAVILVLVVVMTFCLVLLFKYRCYMVSGVSHHALMFVLSCAYY